MPSPYKSPYKRLPSVYKRLLLSIPLRNYATCIKIPPPTYKLVSGKGQGVNRDEKAVENGVI